MVRQKWILRLKENGKEKMNIKAKKEWLSKKWTLRLKKNGKEKNNIKAKKEWWRKNEY